MGLRILGANGGATIAESTEAMGTGLRLFSML
jgi:hypothetical protein